MILRFKLISRSLLTLLFQSLEAVIFRFHDSWTHAQHSHVESRRIIKLCSVKTGGEWVISKLARRGRNFETTAQLVRRNLRNAPRIARSLVRAEQRISLSNYAIPTHTRTTRAPDVINEPKKKRGNEKRETDYKRTDLPAAPASARPSTNCCNYPSLGCAGTASLATSLLSLYITRFLGEKGPSVRGPTSTSWALSAGGRRCAGVSPRSRWFIDILGAGTLFLPDVVCKKLIASWGRLRRRNVMRGHEIQK